MLGNITEGKYKGTIRLIEGCIRISNHPRRDAPVNQCDYEIKLRPNDFLSDSTPYHHHVHDAHPLLSPDLPPIYVGGTHLKAHCALPVHERFGEILVVMQSVSLETPEAFSLHEFFWWPRPLFFYLWITRPSVP